MTLPGETRIAGNKTVADWENARGDLLKGANESKWNEIFREFFLERIETRYFHPIIALGRMNRGKGEGFSIVALHCSLIEFLASTLEGKQYRYQRNGKPDLGIHEYSNSRDIFVKFLESQGPFDAIFSDKGTAGDFYASVRCGLLHEARTKNGWRIKVSQSATLAIDTRAKVIYRNKMQSAFGEFVDLYRQQLLVDAVLQQAFIRKFDSLCSE
jgi:hypothetical protein